MGERTGACRVLVGKPVGRRPSGKPRRMWEDTIKIDLQTVRCDVDYIDVAQYRHRFAGSCELGSETLISIICRGFLDYLRKC
jgi:hypothetical protein